MAYSWTWDNGFPNGATYPAASIDTAFQQLELAINERLNTLMGFAIGTAFADPLINGSTTKSLTALTTLATALGVSVAALNTIVNTPPEIDSEPLTSGVAFNQSVSNVAGGWYFVTVYCVVPSGGINSILIKDLTTPSNDGGTYKQEYDGTPNQVTITAIVKVAANASAGFSITCSYGGASCNAISSYKRLSDL